jgi:hypothetical protein
LLVNTGLTQPLTNTELRASAVPVSLSSLPSLSTGSNNIGSLTDITGTISLPTGAATATNQVTTNNSLSNVDGKLPVSLGQKVGTGSLSIVGASDWIGQTEILDNFGSPISITNPLSTQIFGQTPSGDLENFTINESGRLLTAPGSLTALGQLEVANRFPVVQADFVYGANTDIFSKVEVASGTVTKVSGVPQIKVSTGAASNSYAALYTQSYIKYRDGQGCEALIGCNFSTPAVGSIQFHGVGDFVTSPSPAIVNGYGFGYIDTTWGILWFNGASSLDSPTIFPNVSAFTFIPQSIFNVDKLDGSGPSGLTIDPLTCNLKQFKYPFLGVGNVFFLIEDPNTSRMIVCHIIRYPNSFTVPQLTNPNMRVLSLAYNSTNTSEVSVFASSVAGFIGGDRRFLGPRRVIESKTTLANQTETLLFAVRCNTTINSVRNTSQLRLFRWNGSNTGNNDVRIRIWKNPTITGGSYVNADATNSILATNTTGAYTVGTGRLIHSDTCTSGANFRDFLENLEAFLNPGETFAVTGQGGANSQVPNVSITFVEDI